MTYAADAIHAETAYLAFHLHWNLSDLLDLEHHDRRRYVRETAALVERAERNG
ncbi:DUF6760 family protein [Cryptosporangium arvum]|uniref:DUF6760 family protein n=1 Tax=Cryptosporangium arvum TaxID=80871 RepID=UPI0004B7C844|nr:DUF6760 family protein [Cryptosporangium arvum]